MVRVFKDGSMHVVFSGGANGSMLFKTYGFEWTSPDIALLNRGYSCVRETTWPIVIALGYNKYLPFPTQK